MVVKEVGMQGGDIAAYWRDAVGMLDYVDLWRLYARVGWEIVMRPETLQYAVYVGVLTAVTAWLCRKA